MYWFTNAAILEGREKRRARWLLRCGHRPEEVHLPHDVVRCRQDLDRPLAYLADVAVRAHADIG